MKKIISILLSVVLILSMSVGVFAESEKETAAKELEKYGIISGDESGNLHLEDTITRAEIAKMLVIMTGSAADSVGSGFTDVPDDHWASGYIAQAVSLGIINGMGDGTFAPDECVTYEQAMKMIVCALGWGANAQRQGGYPIGYAKTAMYLGLSPHQAKLSAEADRGDIMIMLSKALDVPIVVEVEQEGQTVHKILDGKNGSEFVSLRTRLEE